MHCLFLFVVCHSTRPIGSIYCVCILHDCVIYILSLCFRKSYNYDNTICKSFAVVLDVAEFSRKLCLTTRTQQIKINVFIYISESCYRTMKNKTVSVIEMPVYFSYVFLPVKSLIALCLFL